tara:strand:- start:2532 stop:3563 length:1032 start_codon:yes stop_codon:yes gene_type:complete
MQRITELYNKLQAKTIQGGRLQPSFGRMPNMRFIFDNGNDKFNTLSILAYHEGYETILKKDNDCAYDDSIGYDDVCYFETADEIEEEIKRLVEHLNPSQCECCHNDDDDDESSEEEVEDEVEEKKKPTTCVDLKINPNADKYYLFLNNKLRLTADVMDMDLPKHIKDKLSQPNFWETMEGAYIKSYVSKSLKETENAVFVGCKNTLIVGFKKCKELLNQLYTTPSTKRFLDGKKIVEVIITKDVEIFQLEDNPNAYMPCIVDASGKNTIWKYKVPYDNNGLPCCFDKKPETMKEIVEQVVSEFIEEKKLEKLPVAIAEPIRENDTRVVDDTIHYDPMMADTFA